MSTYDLPLNIKPSVYGLLSTSNPALADYFHTSFETCCLPPEDAIRQVNNWWRMTLGSLMCNTLHVRSLLDDTMGVTEWTINFRLRVIPALNTIPASNWCYFKQA